MVALTDAEASAIGQLFIAVPLTITAVASLIAAWNSIKAKKEAGAANKAVNNVGSDEPTLREIGVEALAVAKEARQASQDNGVIVGEVKRDLSSLKSSVLGLKGELHRHQRWHQSETEEGRRVANFEDDDSSQS